MKLITLLCLLCLLCAIAFGATTNRIYLTWSSAPDYDTNVSFKVYTQTNPALPVGEWVLWTNIDFITFTNAAKPGEFGRVEIPTATDFKQFFVITASNFNGESDFSDPVFSRRPSRGTGLRIGAY